MREEILKIDDGEVPSSIDAIENCIVELCDSESHAPSRKALLVAAVRRDHIKDGREWAKWARSILRIPTSGKQTKSEFRLLEVGNLLLDARADAGLFKKLLPLDLEKNKALAELHRKKGVDAVRRFVDSADRDPAKLSRDQLRLEVGKCLGEEKDPPAARPISRKITLMEALDAVYSLDEQGVMTILDRGEFKREDALKAMNCMSALKLLIEEYHRRNGVDPRDRKYVDYYLKDMAAVSRERLLKLTKAG